MKSHYEKMFQQPVAFMLARFWVRGIITEVGDDYLVLSNAYGIESTGPMTGTKATQEEPMVSDVTVTFGSIILSCQPVWVFAGYGKTKKGEK